MSSNITLLVICVAAIAAVVWYLLYEKRHTIRTASDNGTSSLDVRHSDELQMSISILPTISDAEAAALVEVKDAALLATIDNVLPRAIHTSANLKTVQDYKEFAQSTGQLYEAIIPQGVTLDRSHDMVNAVRGTYHGKNGYAGAANWLAVDQSAAKHMAIANVTSGAMNAASLVVGQYYMSQIDSKLKGISEEIAQISQDRDSEYWGKVITLADEVKTLSAFNFEIMQNEETRKQQLTKLGDIEHECLTLLNQASVGLQSCTSKNDLDYDSYESEIKRAEKCFVRQTVLSEIADRIAELTFALNLGSITREFSYANCSLSQKHVYESRARLQEWHSRYADRYEIDIENTRRKRGGIVGWLLKYKTVPECTVQMIEKQISAQNDADQKQDLFTSDVRLIGKSGKLYYLPSLDSE